MTNPRRSISNACWSVSVLAILLVLFLLPGMAFATTSGTTDLSSAPALKPGAEKDAKCLKCHSKNKTKSLADGEEMSLFVPLSEYTSSAHSKEGCVSCHKVIADKKHPAKKYRIEISSQRDYSVERNEVCRDCHEVKYAQYEGSIHATMVSHGSSTAPVCSDCHTAHAVEPMTVYEPVSGEPCKNCHEDVFDVYSTSVHGEARKNGNVIREAHIQAPICVDCHSAHDISAVASKVRLRSLCLDCHEGASLAHEQWLPNAGRHLDVVSCAACHAPLVERRVDLELHNAVAIEDGSNPTHENMQQQLRDLDEAGGNLNPEEFRKMMSQKGTDGRGTGVTLQGRMEASSGVKAHSLANKSLAVRSCDSCHKKGADPFQNVTVSITNEDGRREHFAADKEILDSLQSVESVNDFYTIGGTRIPLLDTLVLLSLFAGIAVPLGHSSLGRIVKKLAAKENKNV
jgi:hypothetical protein